MTKFLTLEGLQHYDSKIKGIIPSKSEFETLKNTVANGLTWRNPVANKEALKAITTPKEGWTVSLIDTNQIYRFDDASKDVADKEDNTVIVPTDKTPGAWILLGSAVYGKATTEKDGLMSTDHVKALNKATQDITGINDKFEGANAKSAVKLANKHNFSITGAITANAVQFDGTQDVALNVTNISVDASKITSGVLDIERIPKAALERLVVVENDQARLKLTKEQAQVGDTVKVTETGKMYFVVDDSKLNQEEGYSVYTAGSASSVPWEGITGKPQDFKPSAHNQASNTIDKMTGYSKAGQYQAIAPTDNLNTAVGKLEKGLEGKLNSADMVAISNSEIDAFFQE